MDKGKEVRTNTVCVQIRCSQFTSTNIDTHAYAHTHTDLPKAQGIEVQKDCSPETARLLPALRNEECQQRSQASYAKQRFFLENCGRQVGWLLLRHPHIEDDIGSS